MSVVEMKLWVQGGQVQGDPSDGGHRKGPASYLKLQTSRGLATGQPVYMLDHQRGAVRRCCLILAQAAETTSSWQPPKPRGRELGSGLVTVGIYTPRSSREARADPEGLKTTFQIDPPEATSP